MKAPSSSTARDAAEQAVATFIDDARSRVDAFCAQTFAQRPVVERLRRTGLKDAWRHPVNLVLGVVALVQAKIAFWCDLLGWEHAGRRVARLPLSLPMADEHEVVSNVWSSLLQLSPDNPTVRALIDDHRYTTAQLKEAMHAPVATFVQRRLNILDGIRSLLMLGGAYVLFGNSGLSPFEMGNRLAASHARNERANSFFLGKTIGGAVYDLFPPDPTKGQVVTATLLVFAVIGGLSAAVGLLVDPVLQRMGVPRRQLQRVLTQCEEALYRDLRTRHAPPKP